MAKATKGHCKGPKVAAMSPGCPPKDKTGNSNALVSREERQHNADLADLSPVELPAAKPTPKYDQVITDTARRTKRDGARVPGLNLTKTTTGRASPRNQGA